MSPGSVYNCMSAYQLDVASVIQQQVFRFQVSVYYVFGMKIWERLDNATRVETCGAVVKWPSENTS